MSEYTEVERPFLDQLAAQGWTVIDQGQGVPHDYLPASSGNDASRSSIQSEPVHRGA